MKKNKMMRIASVLLVAVILTTCAISGTFAKYVTKDDASETARVAKFGVTVTAAGSLYGEDYVEADNNTPGSVNLTVESSEDDKKVVAPGTKSADDGMTFAVTGKPEVKVKVTVAVADTMKDVYLKKKTNLPDMTTGNTFNNTEDYYPVKYTLIQTTTGGTTNLVTDGKLSEVKTKLVGLTAEYGANTELNDVIGTLKLTWKWDFDDSGAGTYDKQDTLLGNLAADPALAAAISLTEGTDFNLNSSIGISFTVTQID